MAYYVYIMMDEKNSQHYVGFTNNMARMVQDHRTEENGFFAKNGLRKLIYFERHEEYEEAKRREVVVKTWDAPYFKNILSIQNKNYDDLFPGFLRNMTSLTGKKV